MIEFSLKRSSGWQTMNTDAPAIGKTVQDNNESEGLLVTVKCCINVR